MFYQKAIAEILKSIGRTDVDPRWIEGYMRLANSTLDHLSPRKFRNEVEIGVICVDEDGKENAELCAKSFAL